MADPVTESGAQPAASPTAPVDASTYLASLTPTQYAKWDRDGVLPDDHTADTSSAQPADQAASNPDAKDKAAASEPANPAEKPRKNAQTRTEQLKAENAELQEQLRIRRVLREELARTAAPNDAERPGSSPERTTQADWERYAAMPDAPQEDAFTTYRDFTAAMSVFIADKRFEERTQAQTQHARERAVSESVQRTIATAQQRLQQHVASDPDFAEKVHPALLDITPAFAVPHGEQIGPHHVIAEEMLKSDVQAQLMLHFSTPEGSQEWARLCALPPSQLLRAFGRIEARFEKRADAGAGTNKPAPKTVTSAPTPPITLGKRPAAPADPVKSAIEAGDYRAFEAAEDAKILARRK